MTAIRAAAGRDDSGQLQQLVDLYRRGFLGVDPAALASLWDRHHPLLIYIAMEKAEALRGWSAISGYLQDLPTHLAAIERMDILNLATDVIGDAAVVAFDFSAQARLKVGAVITPAGRVSMLCRRTDAGWLIIHYHESGQAAVAAAQ